MALRQRLLILHNARSGRPGRRHYDQVLAHLIEAGCELRIVLTERAGDGMAAAAAAARSGDYDAVVAAGGDGTVHDVAAGLLGTGVPLGIIPAGTANVFSRELAFPHAPQSLAKHLRTAPARQLPVGDVNGRPFLFVLGVGLDAEAVRRFEAGRTRRLGQLGLAWPVLGALATTAPPPTLRVTTANGAGEAAWVIVTRTRHYAANLMLTAAADLGQPMFHVLRMRGGVAYRIPQLAAMSIGALRHAPGVTLEQTEWLSIEADDPIVAVQVDGEVAKQLPLHITIHPQRLTVIAA